MATPHASLSPLSPRRPVGRPRTRGLPVTLSAGGRGTSALLEAARPVLARPVRSPRLTAPLQGTSPAERSHDEPPDPDAARRDARLLQARSFFSERFHQMPITVRDSILGIDWSGRTCNTILETSSALSRFAAFANRCFNSSFPGSFLPIVNFGAHGQDGSRGTSVALRPCVSTIHP